MRDNGVGGSSDSACTTVVGEQAISEGTAVPKTGTEIVVRVGASPAAEAALGRAAEQSLETGVPLRIVYAWQMTASPSGQASAAFWVASAADARARATRWVLETLGDSAGSVRWTLDIVELPPGLIVPLDAHAADAALELSSQPGGNA
jgi:hypothetical protein